MLKLATKFAPEREPMEAAHRAGFRNAEVFLNAIILADAPAVLTLLREYPFRYALHFPNRLDLPSEALHACVELYQALSCTAMAIHQPMYRKYAETLLRMCPAMRLAVENHRLTAAELEEWADANPGLTLDVEHVWMLTLPGQPQEVLLRFLRDFLARWASKVRHVHLPGHLPGQGEHRPMYCSRELVFAALSLLDEHKLEGLIVSEAAVEYQNEFELRMDVLLFDAWRQTMPPPPTDAAAL